MIAMMTVMWMWLFSGSEAGTAAGEETEDRGEQTKEAAAGKCGRFTVDTDDWRGTRADKDHHWRVYTTSQSTSL